jgi:hypothetical protein
MRIVAAADVLAFVQSRGGRLFVWPVSMDDGYGYRGIFVLETATEPPEEGGSFVRFGGGDFEVLIADERGTPEELHLRLTGWRTKRVAAYWDGHSFASGA